ncbi:MAG TPA: mechanosensitive ion channel domain-containing protein, partial [Longimicrobiales bacterium]
MQAVVQDSTRTVELFGVHFMGLNAANGHKLLLTVGAVVVVWLLGVAIRALLRLLLPRGEGVRVRFWPEQATKILLAALLILTLISIWFDRPARFATAAGFLTAGIAFAMQRVITAIAAYFVILRGRMFNVGDRIVMAGVRGDVVSLGFIRTTIMEMGRPPALNSEPDTSWVEARQYTGRIVTVTNDKIFDEPIYNYSRGFPYIWEELHLPVSYRDDRQRAEQILLEAANEHAVRASELGEDEIGVLQQRYLLRPAGLEPRVYYRLTDNWLELTVRFLAHEHGVRDRKDAMSRYIIQELDRAGIGVASAT